MNTLAGKGIFKTVRYSVLHSRALAVQFPMRSFASSDPLGDKEKGDERIYFTNRDGNLSLVYICSRVIL